MHLTIRQAQVALWIAMQREPSSHCDQNADLWEALKTTPAVREYEAQTKVKGIDLFSDGETHE